MKGLLLKDWYMTKKYCRSYLLICVCFVILSLASEGNMFFVFYPCLLCGMIPVNLLGYDERSRWTEYSGALPYTRAQIVSAKYLIGLFAQIAVLAVNSIAQGIKMTVDGSFVMTEFLVLVMMLLIMSTVTSSLTLPFVFKLGVEKGRSVYFVTVGLVCAVSIVASNLFSDGLQAEIELNAILPVICLIGIGIYALSWYLSVAFYKKREL